MADADVAITAGSGTKIDTRTVGAGTDEHRQVVVIGDPTTAAQVATVDAANRIDAHLADYRLAAVNIATTGSTTLASDTNGVNHALIRIGTTRTGGTILFEVSADGTNFSNAETFKGNGDLWVSDIGQTPTSGDIFRIFLNGYQTLRATVTGTLSGTVATTITLVQTASVITAINTTAPPHAIGYNIQSKTAQYTTTQTGTALWTPTSGRRLVIMSYQIQVGGTTAGTMQLWFEAANADTTYTRGTDVAIFDGEFAPSTTLKPGVVQTGVWVGPAADMDLRVTDSAAINPLTVTVWGYEY